MKLFFWMTILACAAYGCAKFYIHNEVGEAMDTAVMMASPFADVQYRGVSSTLTGDLVIEGVRIRPHQYRDEIYIERMGIDTPSFLSLAGLTEFANLRRNRIPEQFGVILDGLVLPLDGPLYQDLYAMSLEAQKIEAPSDPASRCTGLGGFSPDTLMALGYREQVLSVALRARNDEGAYSFELDAGLADMWDAEARLVLAGNMMSELSLGSAYRPKLRELVIEYTDRSLRGRVEQYCAALGLTPEQTIAAQLASFQFMGASKGIVFDEYVLEPYREFLERKTRFRITARPSEPITMSHLKLYKPSDVPALLNLEGQAL